MVQEWTIAKRDVILAIKAGEEERKKSYCALVWISRDFAAEDFEKLESITNLTIQQQTPLRVVHRRANMTRNKTVHWIRVAAIEDQPRFAKLELCTSAGCYIKEFIHGDFGRTVPSLADLLEVERARCCALDVTLVEIDPERPIDPNETSNKKSKLENVSNV